MAKFQNGLLLLDEPCRGLSIKNQLLIAKIIKKKFIIDGCQIICSTHSDVILRSFKTYAQYFEMSWVEDECTRLFDTGFENPIYRETIVDKKLSSEIEPDRFYDFDEQFPDTGEYLYRLNGKWPWYKIVKSK